MDKQPVKMFMIEQPHRTAYVVKCLTCVEEVDGADLTKTAMEHALTERGHVVQVTEFVNTLLAVGTHGAAEFVVVEAPTPDGPPQP